VGTGDLILFGIAIGFALAALLASSANRLPSITPPPAPPQRPTLGHCADCDERREMTRDGRCAVCGGDAVALAAKLPRLSDDWAPALTVDERIAANRKIARAAVLRRRPATMVEIGGVQ
jgi:hypothetical protein